MHGINLHKCGVCGDPYDDVREHEAGGKYAQGYITRFYSIGDNYINVTIDVVFNIGGYFRFQLCPNNNVYQKVTETCFEEYPLEIRGYGDKYYPDREGDIHLSVEIPDGVTCSQCVLRWKWRGGNYWGMCSDRKGDMGCGDQEEYYNCADIAIMANVNPYSGDTGSKKRTTLMTKFWDKAAHNDKASPTEMSKPNIGMDSPTAATEASKKGLVDTKKDMISKEQNTFPPKKQLSIKSTYTSSQTYTPSSLKLPSTMLTINRNSRNTTLTERKTVNSASSITTENSTRVPFVAETTTISMPHRSMSNVYESFKNVLSYIFNDSIVTPRTASTTEPPPNSQFSWHSSPVLFESGYTLKPFTVRNGYVTSPEKSTRHAPNPRKVLNLLPANSVTSTFDPLVSTKQVENPGLLPEFLPLFPTSTSQYFHYPPSLEKSEQSKQFFTSLSSPTSKVPNVSSMPETTNNTLVPQSNTVTSLNVASYGQMSLGESAKNALNYFDSNIQDNTLVYFGVKKEFFATPPNILNSSNTTTTTPIISISRNKTTDLSNYGSSVNINKTTINSNKLASDQATDGKDKTPSEHKQNTNILNTSKSSNSSSIFNPELREFVQVSEDLKKQHSFAPIALAQKQPIHNAVYDASTTTVAPSHVFTTSQPSVISHESRKDNTENANIALRLTIQKLKPEIVPETIQLYDTRQPVSVSKLTHKRKFQTKESIKTKNSALNASQILADILMALQSRIDGFENSGFIFRSLDQIKNQHQKTPEIITRKNINGIVIRPDHKDMELGQESIKVFSILKGKSKEMKHNMDSLPWPQKIVHLQEGIHAKKDTPDQSNVSKSSTNTHTLENLTNSVDTKIIFDQTVTKTNEQQKDKYTNYMVVRGNKGPHKNIEEVQDIHNRVPKITSKKRKEHDLNTTKTLIMHSWNLDNNITMTTTLPSSTTHYTWIADKAGKFLYDPLPATPKATALLMRPKSDSSLLTRLVLSTTKRPDGNGKLLEEKPAKLPPYNYQTLDTLRNLWNSNEQNMLMNDITTAKHKEKKSQYDIQSSNPSKTAINIQNAQKLQETVYKTHIVYNKNGMAISSPEKSNQNTFINYDIIPQGASNIHSASIVENPITPYISNGPKAQLMNALRSNQIVVSDTANRLGRPSFRRLPPGPIYKTKRRYHQYPGYRNQN